MAGWFQGVRKRWRGPRRAVESRHEIGKTGMIAALAGDGARRRAPFGLAVAVAIHHGLYESVCNEGTPWVTGNDRPCGALMIRSSPPSDHGTTMQHGNMKMTASGKIAAQERR